MFSQFFIRRPIFASVLSILIFIGGAISVWQLPITEYPGSGAADRGRDGDLPGSKP